MSEFLLPERIPNRRATAVGLDAVPVSWSEGFAASFEDAFVRNPVPSLIRQAERDQYYDRYSDGPSGQFIPAKPAKLLSTEEANAQYGIKGRLQFDKATPEPVAEQLHRLKREEIERQVTMQRAQAGLGTNLTAGLVASLLDPLNVALSFVPVVGQAKYAAWAAKSGKVAARAKTGAIEGAVGAALIEPVVYGVAQEEQADYTAVDSLMNLAFGTALGAGLHMGAGYLGDRLAARAKATPLQRLIDDLQQVEKEAALRTAVAQVVEDRPVDVAPVLAAATTRSGAQRLLHGGPEIKGDMRVPAFFTSDAQGAAWYAANRGDGTGSVQEFDVRVERPLHLDRLGSAELIDLARSAGVEVIVTGDPRGNGGWSFESPTIREHSDYDGTNVVDLLYIPAVRKKLQEAGYDGVTLDDVLSNGDIPTTVALSPKQITPARPVFTRETGDALVEAAIARTKADPSGIQLERAELNAEEAAAARAEVAKEMKSLDDEIADTEAEIVELEDFLPPDTKAGEGDDVRLKEAATYEKAWKLAASCMLRRS